MSINQLCFCIFGNAHPLAFFVTYLFLLHHNLRLVVFQNQCTVTNYYNAWVQWLYVHLIWHHNYDMFFAQFIIGIMKIYRNGWLINKSEIFSLIELCLKFDQLSQFSNKKFWSSLSDIICLVFNAIACYYFISQFARNLSCQPQFISS